jgi:hypothetical protein
MSAITDKEVIIEEVDGAEADRLTKFLIRMSSAFMTIRYSLKKYPYNNGLHRCSVPDTGNNRVDKTVNTRENGYPLGCATDYPRD